MASFRHFVAILMLGLAMPAYATDTAATCSKSDRWPIGKSWKAKALPPSHAIKTGRLYRATQTEANGYSLTVERAARYRIAAGRKIWIEMSRDGTSIPSVSHKRAAECSGIHKIVDFNLVPGSYNLTFQNGGDAAVTFMIVRAP
ncbi:MAG TPA: hypothetical protein PKA59_00080 [Chakrabartia sp.]|jgi:hypothetical protein|nr:hypothetical protein [Chakrabartia sp.]